MQLRTGDGMTKILYEGLEVEIIVDATITNKGSSFVYQNTRSFFYNIVRKPKKKFIKMKRTIEKL